MNEVHVYYLKFYFFIENIDEALLTIMIKAVILIIYLIINSM